MKNYLFILFLTVFVAHASNAQCPPGSVTFSTQADIDNFNASYPGCTVIDGNVLISGADISNLNGLSGVTDINGNFRIENNPLLASLNGLGALTQVAYYMNLINNPLLPDLNGLGSLSYIGGSISIVNNATLVSLNGTAALTSIGGLTIAYNAALTNVSGFAGVTTIFSEIIVDSNAALLNLSGLEDVTVLANGLYIANNTVLNSISGLAGLTSIGGSLYISDNPALASLNGLNALTATGDYIWIQSLPALTGLTALSNLINVTGGLTLPDLPLVTTLSGIQNIAPTSITELNLQGSAELATCNLPNICTYLANPGNVASIWGNATGCESRSAVEVSCMASGPQFTWTGAVDADWDNVDNWDVVGVPSEFDDVTIPLTPNDPVISGMALAKSVTVETGATLMIAFGNSLSIAGSDVDGILNNGTIYNFGTILIDGALGNSITNQSGVFSNNGTISIGASATSIFGIYNLATFNNLANGIISIDNTANIGFITESGSTSSNEGNIIIGQFSSVGLYGLLNAGTFTNVDGGIIKIDGSTEMGLNNFSGSLSNDGIIIIGDNVSTSVSYGIYNKALFANNTGSSILIDRATAYGIYNEINNFSNAGSIQIGAIVPISNLMAFDLGTINNNSNGIIKGTGQIEVISLGGTLSPGYSAGTMTFNADANLVNSVLEIEVDGPVAGSEYDQIVVTGVASVGATTLLNLNFSYPAAAGSTFDVVTATTAVSGAIPTGNITITNSGSGNVLAVDVTYPGGNKIRVTVLGAPNVTTWTGAANTDWHTAGNWTDGVPNDTKNATIPDVANDPSISNSAMAKSITVQNGAVLTIAASGSITINGSVLQGIKNEGTVNNSGAITIGSISSTGMYGIYNQGTFTNSGAGMVQIDLSSNSGLYNIGAFTNSATIQIGANATVGNYGLYNQSVFMNQSGGSIEIDQSDIAALENFVTFTNNGIINIGSSAMVGSNGLKNDGTFNHLNGSISINAATNSGIYNSGAFNSSSVIVVGSIASTGFYGIQNNSLFSQTASSITIDGSTTCGLYGAGGTFTNSAALTIGGTASVGDAGILNESHFNNNVGGVINLDNSGIAGIVNGASTPPLSAIFTNVGIIHIGNTSSTGQYGVLNRATINNNAGGLLKIDRSTTAGLFNLSNFNLSLFSTFNNAGSIVIGESFGVGNWGVDNMAYFTNNTGGDIQIDRSVESGFYNRAFLTNHAAITIGSNAPVGTTGFANAANFDNMAAGVLQVNSSTGQAIWNEGSSNASVHTINNFGDITIGNLASVGLYGIKYAGSKVVNKPGGTIGINGCTSEGISGLFSIYQSTVFENSGTIAIGYNTAMAYGIYNHSGSFANPLSNVFKNFSGGVILVEKTSFRCIVNASDFLNQGQITIGQAYDIGSYGLYNWGNFANVLGAEIKIDRFTGTGIVDGPNSAFFNVFSNYGAIIIGGTAVSGNVGIYSDNEFRNESTGVIHINRTAYSGINSWLFGVVNAGEINIGAEAITASYGIVGGFLNLAGGIVHIDGTTVAGMGVYYDIDGGGEPANYGSITFGELVPISTLISSTSSGGGTFYNQSGGIIKGTGSISSANNLVSSGGTLSPGYSPGTMTFSAGGYLENAILEIEISGGGGVPGTDFDKIAVNGAAWIDASTMLELTFSYAASNGTSYDILTATSISGTIPVGNISFTNTGAGNVTGVTVTYPGGNTIRVTVASALPVELTTFTATKRNQSALLRWETALETDLNRYEVEHSANGRDFHALGLAPAAHQSAYSYLHERPAAGDNYYRLRMVDESGTYAYSPIRLLHFDDGGIVQVFPNPTTGMLTITGAAEGAIVEVVDALGNLVLPVQSLTETLTLAPFPNGVYALTFRSGKGVQRVKVVKE